MTRADVLAPGKVGSREARYFDRAHEVGHCRVHVVEALAKGRVELGLHRVDRLVAVCKQLCVLCNHVVVGADLAHSSVKAQIFETLRHVFALCELVALGNRQRSTRASVRVVCRLPANALYGPSDVIQRPREVFDEVVYGVDKSRVE